MGIISSSAFNFNLGWGETRSNKEDKFDYGKDDEGGFIHLVVGLGNAGKKYDKTRHNVGFEVLDCYAKKHSFPEFKESKKFFGKVSEKFVDGKKVILLKPSTMMNLSGKSVSAVQKFYNLKPEDITIVHDELDLDFGVCKTKKGGEGKSSHNGLKDISTHTGSTSFKRIRFGINNATAKLAKAENFVLSKFQSEELLLLERLIVEAAELI